MLGDDRELRRGAKPACLAAVTEETIAAEAIGHAAVAVDVHRAHPVVSAARVLIDLERTGHLEERRALLSRTPEGRRHAALEREGQRRVADEDRSGVAELPESAAMFSTSRVSKSDRETNRGQAGEEVQAGHD